MASIRKRGKRQPVWYIRYKNENGKWIERRGCRDKAKTKELAASIEFDTAKVRAGALSTRELSQRVEGRRPLSEHLDDWRQDMIAGGNSAKHVAQYFDRASKLSALAVGQPLSDLEQGRTAKAIASSLATIQKATRASLFASLNAKAIQKALATLIDAGKSNQTVNHYRAALRAFCRWAYEKGRISESPMIGVKGYNAEVTKTKERRALSRDELDRLIESARAGPIRYGMTGEVRAWAYRVASETGFRVQELRSLTRNSFRVDGDDPSIVLMANATKNRKPAVQPISIRLANELRQWLATNPDDGPVFPLHHETAKAMRADLEAAGVPYKTIDGDADFHSLRSVYITSIVQSNANIKEVQRLARHAKPETTIKHYAKVNRHDLRKTVDSVWPTSDSTLQHDPHTGRISNQPAQRVPNAGAVLGRSESVPDDSANDASSFTEAPNEPNFREFDVIQTERGGFEPPKQVSPLNGLANRRFRPLSHLSGGAPA